VIGTAAEQKQPDKSDYICTYYLSLYYSSNRVFNKSVVVDGCVELSHIGFQSRVSRVLVCRKLYFLCFCVQKYTSMERPEQGDVIRDRAVDWLKFIPYKHYI
jgi:hypothetical protein